MAVPSKVPLLSFWLRIQSSTMMTEYGHIDMILALGLKKLLDEKPILYTYYFFFLVWRRKKRRYARIVPPITLLWSQFLPLLLIISRKYTLPCWLLINVLKHFADCLNINNFIYIYAQPSKIFQIIFIIISNPLLHNSMSFAKFLSVTSWLWFRHT